MRPYSIHRKEIAKDTVIVTAHKMMASPRRRTSLRTKCRHNNKPTMGIRRRQKKQEEVPLNGFLGRYDIEPAAFIEGIKKIKSSHVPNEN